MRKFPVLLVVADREKFVSGLTAVPSTFGKRPPVLSATSPEISPVTVCAQTTPVSICAARKNTNNTVKPRFSFIRPLVSVAISTARSRSMQQRRLPRSVVLRNQNYQENCEGENASLEDDSQSLTPTSTLTRVRAYPSGESLMRKRVRTCSESSSMAPRFDTGSAFARYFMASTSNRCPSTYRGSDVRSRCLRPNLGTTGMVNTLAMNTQFHAAEFASRLPKKYNNSPPDFSRKSFHRPRLSIRSHPWVETVLVFP